MDRIKSGWIAFGQHKGRRVESVPTDYLLWLLDNVRGLSTAGYDSVVEVLNRRGIEIKHQPPVIQKSEQKADIQLDVSIDDANRLRAEIGLGPLI